ncbi:uncharacterized protein MELLADRAFT_117076 [Melampsora larici-populina 98AG31]|uniref:Uncharacterized protein n=1 Tax=Melampsora larici-populina (strain 98AG31 / pathotype 3-4-7) TaxID=747676 RepID=F4RT36_MELLP|nr:uncharacterized protein MELLADRAFT_117076 [Melampsora larici-populina 98AG31]EGG04499.1 hypothetical protein MELLADRAFT_117076 [Melampsora larici-populina 98AG31]
MQRLLRLFYQPGAQAELEREPEREPERPTSRRSTRPSALDFDLPPPTTQPVPPPTLEPSIFRSIFSTVTEPERDYSHLSGFDLMRALLTDNKTVDRSSFYYIYVISTNNTTALNKILDRYELSKLLWGPGKREINRSKSFTFGQLKLLKNLKDEYVEKRTICRIEFENESCANLAIGVLKFLLYQIFKESEIGGEEKNGFECFNHSSSSAVWSWEEIPEKGMFEAEWLAMKKPKKFLQWNRKVHFQSEKNISPVSRPKFLETILEINQFSELLPLETILQTMLCFELLSKPLPNQIKLSKARKKCQFTFPDTVSCKIAYLKIFKCLKEVKEKLVLEKLGSCTDVLIPDQFQLEHDDQWKIWDDCVEWDTNQIINFAHSIRQPTITNTPTITSNNSTRQTESYDPSSLKLPKKWQIQIVLATNLPIIQEPISSDLHSFLFAKVIKHPSSQGFFTFPFSVYLGTEGGSRFRTMVLIFYKTNSHQMKSKDQITLEPDGEILRRQLKEVCHKFNSPEHLLTYRKRKIKWQYLDLAYSSTDKSLQYEIYNELSNSKIFIPMIHQLGPDGSAPNPSDNHRNDDNQRYGNLFAIPGGFRDLSRRHRGRTNSNAATLLDDDDNDEVIPTDSETDSESDNLDSEEEDVGVQGGIERGVVENKDYKAIKQQLEDEICDLEHQKDEPDEGTKSAAFETAQIVSDRRRIEIQERQRRQRRRQKKRKATEDSDYKESEESEDQEDGEEIDWEKKKKKMRKIRGMNDQEDQPDSSGIITNPNFITNTEAIARKHARPLEREPGAVL